MRKAGVQPSGRGDQHFLVDEELLDRIAGYAPPANHALEIGGGVGNLTSRLLRKYGGVTVVERDPRLAGFLRTQFREAEVVHADFLDVAVPDFDVTVSNLPYSASSPILFRLLPHRKPLVVTLQLEFAERMQAQPGTPEYGRLSVGAQHYSDVELLEKVSPTSFEPPPEVESAVVRVTPREPDYEVGDEEFFMDVVRAAFTQRRKTLRNALRNTTHITGIEEDRVEELPDNLLEKRPDSVSPGEFASVAGVLRE